MFRRFSKKKTRKEIPSNIPTVGGVINNAIRIHQARQTSVIGVDPANPQGQTPGNSIIPGPSSPSTSSTSAQALPQAGGRNRISSSISIGQDQAFDEDKGKESVLGVSEEEEATKLVLEQVEGAPVVSPSSSMVEELIEIRKEQAHSRKVQSQLLSTLSELSSRFDELFKIKSGDNIRSVVNPFVPVANVETRSGSECNVIDEMPHSRRSEIPLEARQSGGRNPHHSIDRLEPESSSGGSRGFPTNPEDEDYLRVAKMTFPKYDGSKDPIPWFSRCENFFRLHKVRPQFQVGLASYHLEEDALIWFDMVEEHQEEMTWQNLKDAMNVQFGPTDYEDFYGDLTRLKQVGAVRDYITKFNRLLPRVGNMTERQKISSFTCGLKLQLRMEVKSQKPISLLEAQGLAKHFEPEVLVENRVQYNLKSREWLCYLIIRDRASVKHIIALEHLEHLKELEINNCPKMDGELMNPNEGIRSLPLCIPHLQSLLLYSLPLVTTISSENVSFSYLLHLFLRQCEKLEKFPNGLMNENRPLQGEIKGTKEWWKGLQWQDEDFKSYLSSLF